MITLRKEYIHDSNGKLKDVRLLEKDYGVSFADLLFECDIEGHDIEYYTMIGVENSNNYLEKCKICNMLRECKRIKHGIEVGDDGISKYVQDEIIYGDWYYSKCYECEDSCVISRPMEDFKCPNCGYKHISSGDGVFHTNGADVLLYTCTNCRTTDQVIE